MENLLIGRHVRFRKGLWASGIYIGSARREERGTGGTASGRGSDRVQRQF